MKTTTTGRYFSAGTSPDARSMAIPQTIATVLGAVFLAVGILGFVAPNLFHAHLSWAHNGIHLVSGAAALYIGLAGTLNAAQMFNLAFGAVYGLLGITGFMVGRAAAATVGGAGHDPYLWKLVPGVLELGQVDHCIHVLVGLVFIVGGLIGAPKQSRRF